MASTMVLAARDQLLERQRAEAKRSEQVHRLLAEHYPRFARIGQPMAERGMRLTWQLTQLGLVLVGLGVALSAFGMLGIGAWATGAGLAVALVVIAMTVVGARFGSPYDQLHRAVTQVSAGVAWKQPQPCWLSTRGQTPMRSATSPSS